MHSACAGADQRGLSSPKEQEHVQAHGPSNEVRPCREKALGVIPVEAVRPAKAREGGPDGPEGSRPLAGRARERCPHDSHSRNRPPAKYQDRVEDEIQGVETDSNTKGSDHVVHTAKGPEGGKCHKHGRGTHQAPSKVVDGKVLNDPAGSHRTSNLYGKRNANGCDGRARH